MLAETAIIASRIDACVEVLGDAACYFDPGDTVALRECLVKLIENSDERTRLAASARARVLEKFTWQGVGKQYYELLSNVSGD